MNRPGRERERTLSEAERIVAEAVCEAMLCDMNEDGGYEPPEAGIVDQTVNEFEKFLLATSLPTRTGLRGILRMLQVTPVMFLRSPRGLTELTLRERVDVLSRAEASSSGWLAIAVVGLKVPFTMAAYERGANLKLTGFDRETISTPRGNVPIPPPAPWNAQQENEQ